jgi:hypothetical protein
VGGGQPLVAALQPGLEPPVSSRELAANEAGASADAQVVSDHHLDRKSRQNICRVLSP